MSNIGRFYARDVKVVSDVKVDLNVLDNFNVSSIKTVFIKLASTKVLLKAYE